MADVNKMIPFIFKWEGGFVNDPADLGGATNMGVTIGAWRQVGYDKNGDGIIDVRDLKMLTPQEVIDIVLKPHYWDRWKADEIANQSVAEILVDWVWASGRTGIVRPQRLLGVKADGIVGPRTIEAINGYPDQKELFGKIRADRIRYIDEIVEARPLNKRFEKGWKRRINDIEFKD